MWCLGPLLAPLLFHICSQNIDRVPPPRSTQICEIKRLKSRWCLRRDPKVNNSSKVKTTVVTTGCRNFHVWPTAFPSSNLTSANPLAYPPPQIVPARAVIAAEISRQIPCLDQLTGPSDGRESMRCCLNNINSDFLTEWSRMPAGGWNAFETTAENEDLAKEL
jgi:hypothetical protein